MHDKIDDWLERTKWVEADHELAKQSQENAELALEVDQNAITALEALHKEYERRHGTDRNT